MKVKELIEKLSKVDPGLEVCVFTEDRVAATEGLGIYFGVHEYSSVKCARMYDTGNYVGIGYPGDCEFRIPPNLIEDLD